MSALSFSKRVEGCPVVQALQAARGMTNKGIDGDFHDDFFGWCCGWPSFSLVEDGEEILQLFTLRWEYSSSLLNNVTCC